LHLELPGQSPEAAASRVKRSTGTHSWNAQRQAIIFPIGFSPYDDSPPKLKYDNDRAAAADQAGDVMLIANYASFGRAMS
jgi:hypothetical protein